MGIIEQNNINIFLTVSISIIHEKIVLLYSLIN